MSRTEITLNGKEYDITFKGPLRHHAHLYPSRLADLAEAFAEGPLVVPALGRSEPAHDFVFEVIEDE